VDLGLFGGGWELVDPADSLLVIGIIGQCRSVDLAEGIFFVSLNLLAEYIVGYLILDE
jgi:hypothetical protein